MHSLDGTVESMISGSWRHEGERGPEPWVTSNLRAVRCALKPTQVDEIPGTSAKSKQHSRDA